MRLFSTRTTLTALLGAAVAACTINSKSQFEGEGDSGSGAASAGGGDAAGGFDGGPSSSAGPGDCSAPQPSEDYDGDGFTGEQGDCNDCDPNINPHAIEVATPADDQDATPFDENCDGQIDEIAASCDSGFAVNDFDPMHAAAAIGLCDLASDKGQGIVSAKWVRANGTQLTAPTPHVGVLGVFGDNVTARAGERMLALSSGFARLPGQPDECGSVSCGSIGVGVAPAGFPQDVPGCSGDSEINDDVGLELALKAPTNATGFQYEFTFYSHEYPEFVCTLWNDQYVAIMNPPPAGSINGNISFDAANNPVSVNIALFDVCEGCNAGTAELLGTGFDTWGGGVDDSGATGWLVTTAPVEPGSDFTVRFAIWDTGDTLYDSTVLIDNFTWIADGGSVDVGTTPIPK